MLPKYDHIDRGNYKRINYTVNNKTSKFIT